jgi:DNA-binding NtrC family response regulator
MNRILVLDPESPELQRIADLLESRGYQPVPLADVASLDQQESQHAVILCDFQRLQALGDPTMPVVVVDPQPTYRSAVVAVRTGAADYLPSDTPDGELIEAFERIFTEARDPGTDTGSFPMVGACPAMQSLFDSISKVAATDSSVVITGESGTGKELVARALHADSPRRYAPLISMNCATVPDDLIEAELFGHPGEESRGLLAAANGGTLFLDEIGELPMAAQLRLLEALESHFDVRLISASHRDLEDLVASGQFRSDLYYRLKVVSLAVPPLRDRADDVHLLADDILARTMTKLGKSELRFSDQTREDMRRYPWPGNVRELENAIQRAVILCDGDTIDTALLAIELPQQRGPEQPVPASPDQTIEDYFVSFVTTHQDSMTETELAAKLGISRKSLWERRQRLNIPRKKTKKRGRRRDLS